MLVLMALFISNIILASGSFVATSDGIFYVERDAAGNVQRVIEPKFDARTDKYYVTDSANRLVASQQLRSEADMTHFKLLSPVDGSSSTTTSRDFLGNEVPVLQPLAGTDPRYMQLREYIQSNPGLAEVVDMQIQARNYKINTLQSQIQAGTRDPEFAQWLTNGLQKPIYLEVGNCTAIHHDPRGFIMAHNDGGQIIYRDNSHANRLVIPPNSEVFNGGMDDASAASVVAHELGHMIMDQLYERPNYPATNYHGAHSKNSVTDEGFALSEGWAEALEALSTRGMRDSDSWRIATHDNIENNMYIYENMGVVSGPNDGMIKSGVDMLSTEGVNATLFYEILDGGQIDAPFSKIIQVFENSKPQTYREFLTSYIEQFPEDRSRMIGQFLDTTKYTTVDNTAQMRYKQLHDAQQAYLGATDPSQKAMLQAEYNRQLNEYNQWAHEQYQKAVVEGNIDGAIGEDSRLFASGDLASEYRSARLDETFAKARRALDTGMTQAADSLRQSFNPKSVAITAGTAIAFNLANQLMSGEGVSMRTAFRSVASMQFVGNVVGSGMGAAAGHAIAPLISAFVPIPVAGTLAGALLPTFTAFFGSSLGGNLGAGMSFSDAIRSIDPVALTGQAVGSTVGSILGSMIPIPIVGTMIGGVVGGIIGERIFSSVARLFGYDRNRKVQTPVQVKTQPMMMQPVNISRPSSAASAPTARKVPDDPYAGARLPSSVDSIDYNQMHPNLQRVKNLYEEAYRAYVSAAQSGNQELARKKLEEFQQMKERYNRALGAYR